MESFNTLYYKYILCTNETLQPIDISKPLKLYSKIHCLIHTSKLGYLLGHERLFFFNTGRKFREKKGVIFKAL